MAARPRRKKSSTKGRKKKEMNRSRRAYSPTEIFMASVGALVVVVIAVIIIMAVFGE